MLLAGLLILSSPPRCWAPPSPGSSCLHRDWTDGTLLDIVESVVVVTDPPLCTSFPCPLGFFPFFFCLVFSSPCCHPCPTSNSQLSEIKFTRLHSIWLRLRLNLVSWDHIEYLPDIGSRQIFYRLMRCTSKYCSWTARELYWPHEVLVVLLPPLPLPKLCMTWTSHICFTCLIKWEVKRIRAVKNIANSSETEYPPRICHRKPPSTMTFHRLKASQQNSQTSLPKRSGAGSLASTGEGSRMKNWGGKQACDLWSNGLLLTCSLTHFARFSIWDPTHIQIPPQMLLSFMDL